MKTRNPLIPFVKAGFETLEALAAAIEKYKLIPLESGKFMFGSRGPSIHGAGAVRWRYALTALEKSGFDWKAHIINPLPLIEQTEPPKDEIIQALTKLTKVLTGLRSDINRLRNEMKNKSR